MSGIWIRSLRVDALIAGRRRGDDALMLDLRRGRLVPVVSPSRVVALGNGLFGRVSRSSGEAAKTWSGPKLGTRSVIMTHIPALP